ncbi:MAG: 1-acyl-sn-glycerol-3-phosphate acyltransferase [Clostridia bacterium]|nr:1-acyl-sn-glycerol-3-phosphate acyltransferase [Clostridia bacterium]
MTNKKKSEKKIGKINPIFYHTLYPIIKLIYTQKYHISYDKKVVREIKGPAIVVATHTSDVDHILSALTLGPVRPTYIVSEHFMHNPSTARLIKHMHVITKKMFTPDVSTIRNILRAKKENAVLVIFPEGRLSCYGHTLPIADGTAELIKKLGVDVYLWRAEGAYLTFPKWRDKGCDRIGKINASVKRLLSSEEVNERQIDEIKDIIAGAIYNDDELSMSGVEYKCKDMSRGVDRILYKCPICLEEGNITAPDNHIRCKCGLDATLDSTYRLHNAPFDRINQWFEWQQESIDTDNETLSSKVRLGSCKADGFMDSEAGEGEVYIDKNIFKLTGVIHGEKIDYTIETEKIGAFPITPGEHFDIYYKGRLIYIYPLPDTRMAVKWVCYLDKFMADKKANNTN